MITCAHLPPVLIHAQGFQASAIWLEEISTSLQPPNPSDLSPFSAWAFRLPLSHLCSFALWRCYLLCLDLLRGCPQHSPQKCLLHNSQNCTSAQYYSPNWQAHPLAVYNDKRLKGILMGSFIPFIVLKQSYSDRLLEEFLWTLEDQLQRRDD